MATARKFGQVYYDLGFLSHAEVIECSATDLIGQYVGHTGPKTIRMLERGLGKVLFVNEAYRLGEGIYAQEALNELIVRMTKPKFAGKLVIILAGYGNDIDNLLRVNERLSSRFADEITFPPLNPEYCLQLLSSKLEQSKVLAPALKTQKFYNLFDELSKLSGWGNARDVQTLAREMLRAIDQNNTNGGQLALSEQVATTCIENMLVYRRNDTRIKELELEARADREKIKEEFERRQNAETRKRQEAEAQMKLRRMGICPMGYEWIKQSGGYRCAAGDHWVDDAQLEL
jgi:hypothetical protein